VTATLLLNRLRQKGIIVTADGSTLRIRPASALSQEELDAARLHKAELLDLLQPAPAAIPLDAVTVREFLGPAPHPDALAAVRQEVINALVAIEAGIAAGSLPPRQLVCGRPIADWLPLDEVARLLEGWRRSAGRS